MFYSINRVSMFYGICFRRSLALIVFFDLKLWVEVDDIWWWYSSTVDLSFDMESFSKVKSSSKIFSISLFFYLLWPFFILDLVFFERLVYYLLKILAEDCSRYFAISVFIENVSLFFELQSGGSYPYIPFDVSTFCLKAAANAD